MAETIKIGGELESTATGNVVAAASAIKDKVKNKYQGEINAETDATLNSHASAIQGLNSQNYVTVTATDQTTDVTDVLPATGAANTIYRIGNWDGSQFDASVYSEYAWNGSQYVHLSTKTQVGEVFDISAYHATGGTLATYADLSAALDSNNGGGVPQSLQKGGMSVKFVQSSDNKYIRYNLLADSFTTDVTEWAIDDDGVYVENPEYVNVKTDKDGRILWAIKTDGSIYYGAGIPQQVVDYIQQKIDELGLNEYGDIVTFLGNLIEGDTLAMLLNTKVDKETGKGIVTTQYVQDIENPEWMKVETDNEGKILGGRKQDGTVVENVGFELSDKAKESLIKALNIGSTNWIGKKWVVMGDSLTALNDRTTKRYYDYIQEETGITVVNLAISGTGYMREQEYNRAFYQRVPSIPTDADIVTIFGSGNDNILTLGDVTDSGTTTVCGCINETLNSIISHFLTANKIPKIGIITSVPWNYYTPDVIDNNMALYCDAIVEICRRKSIPVLDLYRKSNMHPEISKFRQLAYSHDEGEGVHPDENGHKIIAPSIREFLKQII